MRDIEFFEYNDTQVSCWVCGGLECRLVSKGITPEELSVANFAITDANYGRTLSIYRCGECGFLFCPHAKDVIRYYEQLEDAEYERTREQRAIQARTLLLKIQHYQASGTLLDVGAGSGILVEQAIMLGYQACGIEPGKWLAGEAAKRSLPVAEGTLALLPKDSRYDVITLVDVLEHVSNPVALLANIREHLNDDGFAVIVTPDVHSIAATLLVRRWWHYRVAHIGYFGKKTITIALKKAGLDAVGWSRPAWYFPLDYFLIRLGQYIPFVAKLAKFNSTKNITIPFNSFDSWMVVVKKSTWN